MSFRFNYVRFFQLPNAATSLSDGCDPKGILSWKPLSYGPVWTPTLGRFSFLHALCIVALRHSILPQMLRCEAKLKNDGSRTSMKLDYAAPPPALADAISAFYLFDAEVGELRDIERASIGQIRFTLAGSGAVTTADGQEEPFFPVSVLGPRSAASHVVARGPKLRMFGLGILPAGWMRLINRPADECADRILPAHKSVTFNLDGMLEKLGAMVSVEDMASKIATVIPPLSEMKKTAAKTFVEAVDRWLESSIDPNIADLEIAVGKSRRQIERLARAHFGAPPKFLVRKYRALRAANAIANGNGEWQEFVDTAYYDQSHFIRDIKEFTGLTPGALRDHASPLTTLAFGRSKLAGSVGPLVSGT